MKQGGHLLEAEWKRYKVRDKSDYIVRFFATIGHEPRYAERRIRIAAVRFAPIARPTSQIDGRELSFEYEGANARCCSSASPVLWNVLEC